MIQTERLNLCPATVRDAAFFLELLNDEAFVRFIGDREVRDLAQSAEYLTSMLEKQAGTNNRIFVARLPVNSVEPGVPVGITSFLKRTELDAPDIGFAFLPEYRGRGYALEATRATLEFVRREFAARRVVAIVSPDNQPSISLLHKLGYQPERELRLDSSPHRRSVLFVPEPG